MMQVLVREFIAPPVNRREILRYAGVRGEADPTLSALLDACLGEMAAGLCYRVCYAEVPVAAVDAQLDLGAFRTKSADLAKCLAGCDKAILFVATVGPLPDRMVARYGTVAPTRALLCQAIGAERIEALCDAFSAAAEKEHGAVLRPRFSPGYGDLSLTVQGNIFRVLEPARRIGVSLTDGLLMAPTKSVTAIIGIKKE